MAEKTEEKKPNRLQVWYRETLGELRKVNWPTPKEAWRLTKIVALVMFAMGVVLGALDYIFSLLVTLLYS